MNNNPDKPENKKGCLIFSLLILAVVCWWAFVPSEEEKKAEEQKELELKYANDLEEQFKREEDSISKIPKKDLVFYEYKLMNESKKGEYEKSDLLSKKTRLELLLERVKGTEYEKKVQKTMDSLEQVLARIVEKETIVERKEYETSLRNSFLDNNLDIKVKVSGKNNTVITLSYALFSDVWFRKFETEGHFDNLYKKGFRKIILTDNYDYTKWMSYK